MTDPNLNTSTDRCNLCSPDTTNIEIWRSNHWRIVRVADPSFPAYYRLILREHVSEYSELDSALRQECFELLYAIERVMIRQIMPTKVNLASLGNMTPHLHWHIIGRYFWDRSFPDAIWGSRTTQPDDQRLEGVVADLPLLDEAIYTAADAIHGSGKYKLDES